MRLAPSFINRVCIPTDQLPTCFHSTAMALLSLISIIIAATSLPVLEGALPFIEQPVGQNVTLGSDPVVFNCTAKSLGYHWLVNNEIIEAESNKDRGITKSATIVDDAVNLQIHLLTVPVNTTTNNGIQIKCYIYTSDTNISDVATLQIQGLLGPVSDLHAVWIDSTSILVSYTPPYTLDGVPITNYTIELSNTNTSTQYYTNTTSTVISVSDWCVDHNITVTAWNRAGEGNKTQIMLEKFHSTVESCDIMEEKFHSPSDEAAILLEVVIKFAMVTNVKGNINLSPVLALGDAYLNSTNASIDNDSCILVVNFTIPESVTSTMMTVRMIQEGVCILSVVTCGTLYIPASTDTSTGTLSGPNPSSSDYTSSVTLMMKPIIIVNTLLPMPSVTLPTTSTKVISAGTSNSTTGTHIDSGTMLKISITSSVIALLLLLIAVVFSVVMYTVIKYRKNVVKYNSTVPVVPNPSYQDPRDIIRQQNRLNTDIIVTDTNPSYSQVNLS